MFNELPTLRQAGFFKEFNNLIDAELLAELNEKRRNEHDSAFGYGYEPESFSTIGQFLAQDDKKCIAIDLEADVASGNEIYVSTIKAFSNVSDGHFSPIHIREVWDTDEGPIHISFSCHGEEVTFDLAYYDDWIDEEVFTYINKEMQKVTDEQFFFCTGPNGEWQDQTCIFIRLSESEKQILEDKLQWTFP